MVVASDGGGAGLLGGCGGVTCDGLSGGEGCEIIYYMIWFS